MNDSWKYFISIVSISLGMFATFIIGVEFGENKQKKNLMLEKITVYVSDKTPASPEILAIEKYPEYDSVLSVETLDVSVGNASHNVYLVFRVELGRKKDCLQ